MSGYQQQAAHDEEKWPLARAGAPGEAGAEEGADEAVSSASSRWSSPRRLLHIGIMLCAALLLLVVVVNFTTSG